MQNAMPHADKTSRPAQRGECSPAYVPAERECLNGAAESAAKSLTNCHAALDGIESRLFRPEPSDGEEGAPADRPEPCLERTLADADQSAALLHKRLARIAERL